MNWTKDQIEASHELLRLALKDTDTEIVDALRRNDGRDGNRESLLAQLDVLEKVGERLNVRYDRITSSRTSPTD